MTLLILENGHGVAKYILREGGVYPVLSMVLKVMVLYTRRKRLMLDIIILMEV